MTAGTTTGTTTESGLPEPRRTLLVVGCGAIGAIVAARLAAVSQVVVYDANAAHVDAINENGLQIRGATDTSVRLRATTNAQDLASDTFDGVLLLTKSGQTGTVVDALQGVLKGAPMWVTLQNGMGNSEILSTLPEVRIARGVTMNAGRYVEPGCVEHLIDGGLTWLGPVRGTPGDLAWLGELMCAGGLPTKVIADPMEAVWSKFVFNCVMNPIGALVGGVNAARYEVPEVSALIDDMAAECKAVVGALGGHFAFDPMDFVRKVRSGEIPISKHAGSMALDIQGGAGTEIEELTGYIVREGLRLGIAVPICRTVYRLVKGLEYARSRSSSKKVKETTE